MSKAPTGAQKVAAFLLHVDRERLSAVLPYLDPRVLSDVATAMTELDESLTGPEALEELYRELTARMYGPRRIRAQRPDELEHVLASAIGEERARELVNAIHERRNIARPLGFLESHPPQVVASVLADEPASVIALALTHLEPALSADVLGTLEPEQALEVVDKIAHLENPAADVVKSVAATLRKKIAAGVRVPPPVDPAAKLEAIARMLNFSNPDTEQSVLDGIEDRDSEMANEIRDHMFTWEELADIDRRAMQRILATVDTRTLAIALKGSPAAVEKNVFANLSSRVQEMVNDERELAGPVPMAEVLLSRNEVLKGVRALMSSGEFRPARAGEELVD